MSVLLPFLSAFYFLIVGLLVLKNNVESHLARIFFAVCFTTFCWHYPFSFAYNSLDSESSYYLFKISWCAILFLPTTIYHFFSVLSNSEKETKLICLSYISSLILLIIHISTNLIISEIYTFDWGFYPKSGILLIAHILQTFIVVTRGLYLGYRSLRSETDYKKRSQTKYCMVGFLIYLGAAIDYLVNYGVVILPPPPGFVFVTISLTIISYAIVRHSLLDIGIFFSAALSKLIIYLLFFLIFVIGHLVIDGSYLPDNVGNLAIAIVLVVLFCETYSILLTKIRGISDLVFTQGKKKDKTLKNLISNLESLYSPENVCMELQKYFSTELNIKIRSFYVLQDLSKSDNFLYHEWLSTAKEKKTLLVSPSVNAKMLKKGSYLVKSEFKSLITNINGGQILVPFIFAKKVLGFCIVSMDKNLESWHYELFNSLVREIGMIFDRVRIYQDFLAKEQEHLKEEEKAKIYKSLAGSIAHEVRNPLNTINVINGQINDALRNLDNEIMEIVNKSDSSENRDED